MSGNSRQEEPSEDALRGRDNKRSSRPSGVLGQDDAVKEWDSVKSSGLSGSSKQEDKFLGDAEKV